MVVTKEEIKASCERALLHIEKYGIGCRPITDADRARFEELKAMHKDRKNNPSATQVAEAA